MYSKECREGPINKNAERVSANKQDEVRIDEAADSQASGNNEWSNSSCSDGPFFRGRGV